MVFATTTIDLVDTVRPGVYGSQSAPLNSMNRLQQVFATDLTPDGLPCYVRFGTKSLLLSPGPGIQMPDTLLSNAWTFEFSTYLPETFLLMGVDLGSNKVDDSSAPIFLEWRTSTMSISVGLNLSGHSLSFAHPALFGVAIIQTSTAAWDSWAITCDPKEQTINIFKNGTRLYSTVEPALNWETGWVWSWTIRATEGV